MTWYPGSTPYLRFTVRDEDRALVAPTAVTLSIYDPNGTAIVSDAACSTSTTGIYYYASWTVLATSLTGTYTWIPLCSDGTILIGNKKFEFQVEKPTGD